MGIDLEMDLGRRGSARVLPSGHRALNLQDIKYILRNQWAEGLKLSNLHLG